MIRSRVGACEGQPNAFGRLKKIAQAAFLRSNGENQKLTVYNRAVSVENLGQKPN